MAAAHITDAEFQQAVLNNKLPVLVDFYATWCGPCKAAAPILDKLSDEFVGKITIVKMDVDENTAIPAKFGVLSIPTVIAFKDGKEVGKKIGFGGENGFRQLIDQILK